jgi:uncharacterized protein YecT (DUF1311 family)
MIRTLLIALAVLGIAQTAGARGTEQDRGIDCGSASSALEKMTCSDPQMMEYDARIAAAYQRALEEWDGAIFSYVAGDQRHWLSQFRAIETPAGEIEAPCPLADIECIRRFMLQRVNWIESGAYRSSGVYRGPFDMKLLLSPGLANRFHLRFYDPVKMRHHIQLALDDTDTAAMWDGPDTMMARMGDMYGNPLPDGECTLWLKTAANAVTIAQVGQCGGYSYVGHYMRQLDDDLSAYEVDLY